jgi:hypothetical protein
MPHISRMECKEHMVSRSTKRSILTLLYYSIPSHLKQDAEGETMEEGSWEHLVEQSKRRIEHFSFGGSESKVSLHAQSFSVLFYFNVSSSSRSLGQVEIETICSVGMRCKIGEKT